MVNNNSVQDVQKPVGSFDIEKVQAVKKGKLIFHVAASDPAGAIYNLVQATNRYTRHRARLFTMTKNHFEHPTDIFEIADYGDEIEALLQQADILHFNRINEDMTLDIASSRPRSWKISEVMAASKKKKRIVQHVHGHPYERAHYKDYGATFGKKGHPVLCSTPDLEKMFQPYCDARYFPNCVPVWDTLYLPRQTNGIFTDGNGVQRWLVAQAVTDPNLKDTGMIEVAAKYVGKIKPLNLLTVQGVPFKVAMVQRRAAHVIFDHMHGYYGLGTLEGSALGKPVICGIDDVTIEAIMKFFKIPDIIPWQRPRDQSGLNDALMDLIANPEQRDYIGRLHRAFMENIWSDKYVGERLGEFYESL